MFDNLGKALSLVRELRHKSQAQVAVEAGIGKSQLSKYESGKELPKFDSLRKVLGALDVGAFEIFYTMHLIDMQEAQLNLPDECKRQELPPLVFPPGSGVLAGATDEVFQKLFTDVLAVFYRVSVEKVREHLPRKN
jgi:transcriptional regulator with XRE-family HTH domain